MVMQAKNKNNARGSNTAPLKEVIESLLESYRLDAKYNQTKIKTTWEQIMGKTIAKRTSRIFFKNKVMFVEFNSAPLKNELSMKKQKFLELLQQEFGRDTVEEIIIL